MGNGVSSPKRKQKNNKGAKAQTNKNGLAKQTLIAAATTRLDASVQVRAEPPSTEPKPEPKSWIPKPIREGKEPEIESKPEPEAESKADLETEPEPKGWAYRCDMSKASISRSL